MVATQLRQSHGAQQQRHELVREPRPRAAPAPGEPSAFLDYRVAKPRERYDHQGQGAKSHTAERDLDGSRIKADRKQRSRQRRTVSSAGNERQPYGRKERKRQGRTRGDGRLPCLYRHELGHPSPPRCQDRQLERLTL